MLLLCIIMDCSNFFNKLYNMSDLIHQDDKYILSRSLAYLKNNKNSSCLDSDEKIVLESTKSIDYDNICQTKITYYKEKNKLRVDNWYYSDVGCGDYIYKMKKFNMNEKIKSYKSN